MIDVTWAAGRSSHFPLQPKAAYPGQVGLVGDGAVRVPALVRRLAAAVRLDPDPDLAVAVGRRRTASATSSIGKCPYGDCPLRSAAAPITPE